MRIRRSKLTRDYLQVPNATARDDRISHMARGVLIELLSRPDGWETTADEMWRRSTERHGKGSPGRRAFRAAFAELKDAGYMAAERESLPGGRFGTVLIVTDVPHGGTSAPPAVMGVSAGRTDVPLSDVPHGGTSNKEDGEKKTKKTNPPLPCGPKSSDLSKKAAAPTPLREVGLPLIGMVDHLPPEDTGPVVGTATIPGEADLAARLELSDLGRRCEAAVTGQLSPEAMIHLAEELDRAKRHHMQGCWQCQQRTSPCRLGAPLVAWWAQLGAVGQHAAAAPF